jgi:signal peptidase complex subunit 2
MIFSPELKRNLPHHSYLILTSLQTLYSYFVEGETIFVGRRKTFSKRVSPIYPVTLHSSYLASLQIMTERITISSRTLPVSSSKTSSQPSSTNSPSYSLSINYVQSTSGGKSLLAKGRSSEAKEYSAFFDEKGVMAQEVFERWVGELVEAVMEGKGA